MAWFPLGDLNWIAVLVAFLVTFVFGWLWYSPQGFFRVWQRHVGFTDDDMKNADMRVAFGGTIAGNLLGVITLATLMVALGVTGWWEGLLFGGLIGLVFRGGAHLIHNGFALRKPLVTVIDTAHDASALALAGVVIGLIS